jgi:hypothetical protein
MEVSREPSQVPGRESLQLGFRITYQDRPFAHFTVAYHELDGQVAAALLRILQRLSGHTPPCQLVLDYRQLVHLEARILQALGVIVNLGFRYIGRSSHEKATINREFAQQIDELFE